MIRRVMMRTLSRSANKQAKYMSGKISRKMSKRKNSNILCIVFAIIFIVMLQSDFSKANPLMKTEISVARVGQRRLITSIFPLLYSLNITANPTEKYFHGSVDIDVRITKTTDSIVLHGSMDIKTAMIDTKFLVWEYSKDEQLKLYTEPRSKFAVGMHVIKISYRSQFSDEQHGFFVNNGTAITHFEPTGARLAFPCFDEPEFKAIFNLAVTVPIEYLVISNTEIVRNVMISDWHIFEFASTIKLPSYLLAWCIFRDFLVVSKTIFNKTLEIRIFGPHGISEEFVRAPLLVATQSIQHLSKILNISLPIKSNFN